MGVALVAHIEDQSVHTGVKNTVQRYRKFHKTKIGGQMSAGSRNTAYQILPELLAQKLTLPVDMIG